MIAKRAFVLLLLASCGGREGRAPVSRPSAAVSAPTAEPIAAPIAEVDAGPPAPPPTPSVALTVRDSEVIVTGGLGYSTDRYMHAGEPKPRDAVTIVRVTCVARGQPEDENKKYACAGAERWTSADATEFDRRVGQCFKAAYRAATSVEAARVLASRTKGALSVPAGTIFAIETRYISKVEERRTQHCAPSVGHPCDPATFATGRMLEHVETDFSAAGPADVDARNPYSTWPLGFIDLAPMPAPLDAIDVASQPHVVRAAVLFDRAVEAARSKDRARIAAAVKALEDDVAGFADRSLQPIADRVSRDLPTLRALAEGRATVGDACAK